MKWLLFALGLVVLAAVPLGLRAGAQDGELEGLLEDEKAMVLRVHNVADLTIRLTEFIRPNLILKAAGAEVSEDAPLFGAAWEGARAFTGIEDLAELVVQNVHPEAWGVGGATVRVVGSYALVVTAPPAVQDAVEEYIGALRANVGRLVTLSLRVIAFEGELPSQVLFTPEEGRKLIRDADAGDTLALSTRITAFSGQRVSLYRAVQRSYVQDYDVEVAEKSSIADPIVNVQQLGLSLDARCVTRGDSHVVIDLRAFLTAPQGEDRIVPAVGGPVTAPAQRLVDLKTTVSVPVDGFALVGSGRGADGHRWALLVSPHVERLTVGKTGGGK